MPRRLLKKITPHPTTLQSRWYLKVFGSRVTDPALWSLQRRAVTAAFGLGLSICFIPLPIHLPLAVLIAILGRINVPTIVGTVLLVESLHRRAGVLHGLSGRAAVLGEPVENFDFQLSFDWVQHGLGPLWKPFLVGCGGVCDDGGHRRLARTRAAVALAGEKEVSDAAGRVNALKRRLRAEFRR